MADLRLHTLNVSDPAAWSGCYDRVTWPFTCQAPQCTWLCVFCLNSSPCLFLIDWPFPLPSSTCRVLVCPFTGASEWRRRRRCSPCQRLPSVSLSSCSGFWVVAGCGVVGEAASGRPGQCENMNHVVEEVLAADPAGSSSYMFIYKRSAAREELVQYNARRRVHLMKTCVPALDRESLLLFEYKLTRWQEILFTLLCLLGRMVSCD